MTSWRSLSTSEPSGAGQAFESLFLSCSLTHFTSWGFFFSSLECFHDTRHFTDVCSHTARRRCVSPLVTLNLVLLGSWQGSERRQLRVKLLLVPLPERCGKWPTAQRGSLSPHRGRGCEKITGSDKKCLSQKLQAAPERIFSALWVQIPAGNISSAPLLLLSQC